MVSWAVLFGKNYHITLVLMKMWVIFTPCLLLLNLLGRLLCKSSEEHIYIISLRYLPRSGWHRDDIVMLRRNVKLPAWWTKRWARGENKAVERRKPKNAVQCGVTLRDWGCAKSKFWKEAVYYIKIFKSHKDSEGHWKVLSREMTVLNFWKLNAGQIVENGMNL